MLVFASTKPVSGRLRHDGVGFDWVGFGVTRPGKVRQGGVRRAEAWVLLMREPDIFGHNELMVTAAFRYCLGRRSVAVSLCCEWLMKYWDTFMPLTRKRIIIELKEAFVRHSELKEKFAASDHWSPLGDACDYDEWDRLLKFAENKEGKTE